MPGQLRSISKDHRNTRSGAGVRKGIGVAEQIGGDGFDSGDRATFETGDQRTAIVDDIKRFIGGIGAKDTQGVNAGAAQDRIDAAANRVNKGVRCHCRHSGCCHWRFR